MKTERATDLPRLQDLLSLDLAADGSAVFIVGRLANGDAVRLPMDMRIAMQLLAVLDEVRTDLGICLPALPVEKDAIQ